MKIIEKEVIPIRKDCYCEKCNIPMIQRNDISLTYPPIFYYDCPQCGTVTSSEFSYPMITYKEKNNENKRDD